MKLTCVKYEYEDYGLYQPRYFSDTVNSCSLFYPHSFSMASTTEPKALANKRRCGLLSRQSLDTS